MKKDIVLIVGGGGMSGIFSAGVLKAFEDPKIFNRVHSVYAVSVGACTSARFLVKQSELGGQTFYTRFNSRKFLNKRFVRYFFQVLKQKNNPEIEVQDIFNFDYFTNIILRSKDKIDMERVADSSIGFFVKVFNKNKEVHEYLSVKEPDAYKKVLASASMTPLTSKHIFIDDEEFFDGDTIPSDIEESIIKEHSDKIIVRIENKKDSLLSGLNVFTLAVVYTLLFALHDTKTANLYLRNFFKKLSWNSNLKKKKEVVTIGNDIPISTFTKNDELLKKAYENGLQKGREFLKSL